MVEPDPDPNRLDDLHSAGHVNEDATPPVRFIAGDKGVLDRYQRAEPALDQLALGLDRLG